MGLYFGFIIMAFTIAVSIIYKKTIQEAKPADMSFDNALLGYTTSLVLMFSSLLAYFILILFGNIIISLVVFFGVYLTNKNTVFNKKRIELIQAIEEKNMHSMYAENLKLKGVYLLLAFVMSILTYYIIGSSITNESSVSLTDNIYILTFNNIILMLLFAPRFFISSDELLYYCYRTYTHLQDKKS